MLAKLLGGGPNRKASPGRITSVPCIGAHVGEEAGNHLAPKFRHGLGRGLCRNPMVGNVLGLDNIDANLGTVALQEMIEVGDGVALLCGFGMKEIVPTITIDDG